MHTSGSRPPRRSRSANPGLVISAGCEKDPGAGDDSRSEFSGRLRRSGAVRTLDEAGAAAGCRPREPAGEDPPRHQSTRRRPRNAAPAKLIVAVARLLNPPEHIVRKAHEEPAEHLCGRAETEASIRVLQELP